MQYNDIQIIIKQYGRTGNTIFLFLYISIGSELFFANIFLKAILNLDIENDYLKIRTA